MSSTFATFNPVPAGQPSNSQTSTPVEVAQANLYLLLSRAFALPEKMKPDWPTKLRLVLPDLAPNVKSAALKLAGKWEEALLDKPAMSLAFARLFLGPFEILAPPYASFYLESNQRLMGEVSMAVARSYAAAGLVPDEKPREAPDHVALEWEFLYFLTYKYLVTDDEKWMKQREDFLKNHMSLWMVTFAEVIKVTNIHPFYDALADLILTTIQGTNKV